MREIIFVNIGQAGVNIGNEVLKELAFEKGFEGDQSGINSDELSVLFREKEGGGFSSRTIFVDLDGECINSLKKCKSSTLIDSENFISSKEDSSNINTRGRYTLGRKILQKLQERIRFELEACDNHQGFIFCHSIGGGTGSGVTQMALDELNHFHGKTSKINLTVFPSDHLSHVIVETYNSVLGLETIFSTSDACFILDNPSIFNIGQQKLNIERPSYQNLNQIIAYATSSIFGAAINSGTTNNSLQSIISNSIPNPRLKFLTASFSPLQNQESSYKHNPTTYELTSEIFNPSCSVCSPAEGDYISSTLMFKGDVVPREIQLATAATNTELSSKLANWVESSVNVGYDESEIKISPELGIGKSSRSLSMIANTTGILPRFEKMIHNFDMMFAKRPFVHWYVGEGLSEGFFEYAREEMQSFIDFMKSNGNDRD